MKYTCGETCKTKGIYFTIFCQINLSFVYKVRRKKNLVEENKSEKELARCKIIFAAAGRKIDT